MENQSPDARPTSFEKVVDFNFQFGVLPSKDLKPKLNIFDNDPKQVEFCLKLIREEVSELEAAVKDKDFVETVDALADITYVVFGMAARLGVNLDEAFNLVHENNMSKLCMTEKEAQETVEDYKTGVGKLYGYDSPKYRKAPDNTDGTGKWIVYNESTHKILKSIKWKPVDLSYLTK